MSKLDANLPSFLVKHGVLDGDTIRDIADTVDIHAISPGKKGDAALGKVRGYLLNESHVKGRSKAKLLLRVGFDPLRPELLETAIRQIIRDGKPLVELRDGRRLVSFDGILVGPPPESAISDRSWRVVIQWEEGWRLVTMRPIKSPAE